MKYRGFEMSKKILILTQNFYPVIGSSGNRNKNLYELLKQNGFDVTVLTTEPAYPNKNLYQNEEFWDEQELNNDDNIIRVKLSTNKFENTMLGRLFFYLEITYQFRKKIRQLKKTKDFDYVLVSTPPIFIFSAGYLASKLFKAEIILDVRDLWPDTLTGIKKLHYKPILSVFQRYEKRMYNKASKIMINSEGFRQHITEKLSQEKEIIYIPNGARKTELNDDTASDFSVIYTGNLGLAQDVERIEQLAVQLNKENIPFKVIGYGYKANDFIRYIEENALSNVTVCKPTTRKNSLEAIKSSHVSVAFLNQEEVFTTVLPGKIIDYITCKTPVIASVDGQAANVIEKHDVGYVTRDGDINEMVQKIKYLRDQSEEHRRLQENCEELVKKHFLWENNITNLVKLLK